MGIILLKNANIITPYEEKKNQSIIIEDDLIRSIISPNSIVLKDEFQEAEIYDLKGKFIVPGFIDILTHCGNGIDCLESNFIL